MFTFLFAKVLVINVDLYMVRCVRGGGGGGFTGLQTPPLAPVSFFSFVFVYGKLK